MVPLIWIIVLFSSRKYSNHPSEGGRMPPKDWIHHPHSPPSSTFYGPPCGWIYANQMGLGRPDPGGSHQSQLAVGWLALHPFLDILLGMWTKVTLCVFWRMLYATLWPYPSFVVVVSTKIRPGESSEFWVRKLGLKFRKSVCSSLAVVAYANTGLYNERTSFRGM